MNRYRYPMGPSFTPWNFVFWIKINSNPHPAARKVVPVVSYTNKCPTQFWIMPVDDNKKSTWPSIWSLVEPLEVPSLVRRISWSLILVSQWTTYKQNVWTHSGRIQFLNRYLPTSFWKTHLRGLLSAGPGGVDWPRAGARLGQLLPAHAHYFTPTFTMKRIR